MEVVTYIFKNATQYTYIQFLQKTLSIALCKDTLISLLPHSQTYAIFGSHS